MDAAFLARIQFGLTVGFHYIFPLITIGMAWLIVWMLTRHLISGDDVYRTKKVPWPGYAKRSDKFRGRPGVGFYFADTSSVGLFLDVGGTDTYWGELKNDSRWLDPADSPNWQDRNFSIGVDRAAGAVDLTPIPTRAPSAILSP